PVHMESVSLVDAFVLADPDAGRQIDLNLDGSGAGHGLLHEHSGAKIFSADVQLPAKLSKTSFLPRAALRNETTGFPYPQSCDRLWSVYAARQQLGTLACPGLARVPRDCKQLPRLASVASPWFAVGCGCIFAVSPADDAVFSIWESRDKLIGRSPA